MPPPADADLERAFREALSLRAPADRIDALVELVRWVDAHGDAAPRRAVRAALVDQVTYANLMGRNALALPAFAWLLADFEADPDAAAETGVDADRLLTWYGDLIPVAAYDPAVPRATVEGLLKDHARRTAAWGGETHNVADAAFWAAVRMGDYETLPALFAGLHRERTRLGLDYHWNCAALIGIFSGHTELALSVLRPLAEGRVPGWHAGSFRIWILRPLVWAGRHDEADAYYRRVVAEGFRGAEESGFVVEYAARVRDETTLRRWLPGLLRACPSVTGDGALELVHASLACEVLAAMGDAPLVLPLPDDFPDPPPTDARGRTRPGEAAGPLWQAATSFMAALDARNGNATFSHGLRSDRAFVFGPAKQMPRLPADRGARLRALWDEHGTPPPGPGGDPPPAVPPATVPPADGAA